MLRRWPARRALDSVLVVLLGLLAAMLAPLAALAADPAPIPQGPLPVGDLAPVEFSFLTVDVTVSPAGDGVALEARSRARLKNPDKKTTFERQVTFAGPSVSGVKVGTQNGGVQPAGGGGPWSLTLRPEGDGVIEGTQRVTATGPVVDLTFDWGALQPWGARLGAARLTLRFPAGVDAEQLLIVDPAPTDQDAVHLTWSLEKFRPAGRVRVLLVTPPYWQALAGARRATAGAQASAADYLALAAALRPLAGAEAMPPARSSALMDELHAALRQAVAASPEEARPHKELAMHLRVRAKGDPSLLAEAVAEFKAAHDLAPGDADVRQRLLGALDELIAACRQAHDGPGLLAALDVAQAVDAPLGGERAAAYADLAVQLLEAGRAGEAEAAIAAGFGDAALTRYAFLSPRFASVSGEVETLIGRRIMRFQLVPAPGAGEAAARDVAALVEATSRVSGCQVRHTSQEGKIRLEISVPFASSEDLRTAGLALAGALGADLDPALRLVLCVAGPAQVDFRAVRGRSYDRLGYSEMADLSPAAQALERHLEQLRRARAEAEGKSDDPIEAARRRWALALLERYQAGWEALAAACRVTYRLLPPEDIVAPSWALAWGEKRALTWSTNVPRPERLGPYTAAAVAAALVLLSLALIVRAVTRGAGGRRGVIRDA